MSGRIDFQLGFKTQTAPKENNADGLRFYILGNFSGHKTRTFDVLKFRNLSIDNFEQVMSQLLPTLELGAGIKLEFKALEDFHPDSWLEKIPLLADLQSLKKQLGHPDTARQAAAKIQAHLKIAPNPGEPAYREETIENQTEMLERLLGKKPENTPEPANTLNQFLNSIVSPHISQTPDPQYQVLNKLIETTMNQVLQTLLHSPDFQELEAIWLATAKLIQEESADDLSIFLLDITQDELLTELRTSSQRFTQQLQTHTQAADTPADTFLIGAYHFDESDEARQLLQLAGQLAEHCNAGFISNADRKLIVLNMLNQAKAEENWWHYLAGVISTRIILAYPRYLLRLPYGKKRDPIASFAFEECPGIPQTNQLLWGNPAFLCAQTLIRVHQGNTNENSHSFKDTPAFSYEMAGEQVLQAATETLLNETQAQALLSHGITPVIAFRQHRGLRLLTVTTLSEHA